VIFPNNLNQTRSIDKILEQLSSLDLSITSDTIVLNCLKEIGKIALVGTTIKKGQFVCRGRINETELPYYYEKDIDYIKDLKIMPPYNRASLCGESMFYGCITVDNERYCQMQTISEISKVLLKKFQDTEIHEEYITMGKWRVIEDFQVASIAYHDDFLKNNGHLRNMNTEFLSYVEKYPDKKADFFKIVQFLASEFAKPVKEDERYNYKISGAFSKIALYFGASGVLYPNVIDEGKGFNIAISPTIKDTHLKLEKLVVWRTRKKSNNNPFTIPYLYCDKFTPDGKFIWEDPHVYVPEPIAERVLEKH
jgi:hypothetical protein